LYPIEYLKRIPVDAVKKAVVIPYKEPIELGYCFSSLLTIPKKKLINLFLYLIRYYVFKKLYLINNLFIVREINLILKSFGVYLDFKDYEFIEIILIFCKIKLFVKF